MIMRAALLIVCWLGVAACGDGTPPSCAGAASGEVCQDTACSGSSRKYRLCLFGDPAQRCSQASYSTSAGVLKGTCVCSGACAEGSSAALAAYNDCVAKSLKEACAGDATPQTCAGAASGEMCRTVTCDNSSKQYRLCTFYDAAQRCSQETYATSAGASVATCVCSGACQDRVTDEYVQCFLDAQVNACR